MTSAWTCRGLVLAAGLLLMFGCEAVAPLRSLPNKDSGSEAPVVGDVEGQGGAEAGSVDIAPPSDTGVDAVDAATDHVTTGVTCDRWTRFNAPNVVVGLNRNPGSQYRISLASDELTAYLSQGSAWWQADLYKAKRIGRTEPFGSLFLLAELNSDVIEDAVSVTGDELTVFVDSNRSSGRAKIYVATRPTIAEDFAKPAEVGLNLDALDLLDPYVVLDGTALYFTANLDDNPTHVGIYRVALNGTTAGEPTLVMAHARFPVVAPDELTLYFIPYDVYDVWMATRASGNVPFDEPVELSELNTIDAMEFPQWISPDGCRLYMSRGTVAGDGSLVSFVADRAHN